MLLFVYIQLSLKLDLSLPTGTAMLLYKYRLYIFITLLSIFTAKLFVSALPVFFCQDRMLAKSFMPGQEQEQNPEGESKDVKKGIDFRTDLHYSYIHVPVLEEFGVKNCFIDHAKRYVDPCYPSVPTPPPNLLVL